MRRRTAPDAGMLILTGLDLWTGEERLQYVSALRELSVRSAVPVTDVPPADPLDDAPDGPPRADLPAPSSRPAYAAAFGLAERGVRALWQPDTDADVPLRAAIGHAIAELSRMRELLINPSGG